MADSTINLAANVKSQSGVKGNIDISLLEKQTGLPVNGDILKIIKHSCLPNYSKYAASLAIISQGFACVNSSYQVQGSDICTITPEFYNNFTRFLYENGIYEKMRSKSGDPVMDTLNEIPNAIASGFNSVSNAIDDDFLNPFLIGMQGLLTRLTPFNTMNPMTGPGLNTPCLGADLLNSIHPGLVDDIEQTCNIIRTHAWMTLPSDCFGGIQQAMWYISGAVSAFYQAIMEVYQGVQRIIQQFLAAISAVFRMIQNYITSLIEQIIPLDLLCLILDAVQTVLDDIGFFAQLFKGSDGLFKALNAVQTVVNYASFGVNFGYDPLNGLATLFPKQAAQVYDFINKVGDFPQAYLSKLISHVGFGVSMNNEGLAIANTIVQRFGLGSQLGPLEPILASAGTVGNRSKWYRTANTGVTIGGRELYAYSYYNPMGGSLDVNLNVYGTPVYKASDFR